MKKNRTLACRTAALGFLLMAAAPQTADAQMPLHWERRYGGTYTDVFNALVPTADSGFAAAGRYAKATPSSHDDLWIQRMDKTGRPLWSRTYGGTSREEAHAITQTADGGHLVAGEANSNNGDVTGRHGMSDAWLLKLDSAGNILWKRCYGGSMWDNCSRVLSLADGSIVLYGMTTSGDGDLAGINTPTFFGESNIWLLKLDAAGTILWQRTYGDLGYDAGMDIAPMPDGGFAMAGTVAKPSKMYELWACRIDSAGAVLWEQHFGYEDYDYANALVVTPDTAIILAGYTMSAGFPGFKGGPSDMVAAKLDGGTGSILWQKTLGGTGADIAKSVVRYSGLYLIAGATTSTDGDITGALGEWDVSLMAIDDSGIVQWSKNFGSAVEDGGSNDGVSIITTPDGGLAVASFTASTSVSSPNAGNWDGYLLKLKDTASTTAVPQHAEPLPVALYPNPATDKLTIQTGKAGRYAYTLADAVGKRLSGSSFISAGITLDIASLPAGVYVVRVSDAQGRFAVGKIVKD